MNPFTRKLVKSQAEKDRLIQEAAKEWDELGEHSYLVAASEEDYLTRVADGIEVESPAFVPARELTKAERDEIDGELLFSKIYDGRTSYVASEDVPAWYRPIHEQEQRASFEKLVAPAIRERKWLEAMVNEAFEKAREQLAKANSPSIQRETIPIRSQQPEREGIHPAMAAVACDDSDGGRLVKAWLENNREAMREIVRRCELAAA